MSFPLPRYLAITNDINTHHAIEHAVKVEKPIQIEPSSPAGRRLLRGVPVAGAASGTSPGTDPLFALLEKERIRELPKTNH